jgi:N12 class adenine-specific DNA methylase
MTDLTLTATQQAAIDRLYEHDATILVAATGAGKSVICLTAIKDMIDDGQLNRAIIACPGQAGRASTLTVKRWTSGRTSRGLRVFEVAGAARPARDGW